MRREKCRRVRIGVLGIASFLLLAAPVAAADGVPPAPSTPDLLSTDDSGATSDNITSSTRPRFRVTATRGTLVELLADDVVLGSALATTGVATIQVEAPLADGTYQITARARVNAQSPPGEPSDALEVTIDTVAPAVPILTLPAAEDSGESSTDGVTNVAVWHIYGSLDDAHSVPTFEHAPNGREQTYPAFPSWTFFPDADGGLGPDGLQGTWTYQARGVDVAGNTSEWSQPLAIVFDTIAPLTPSPPDLRAADDSGAFGDDEVTNVARPQFDVVLEPGALATFFADGTTLDALADGAHGITAQARDLAGNVSALSEPLSVTIDTTNPAGTVQVSGGARSVRDPAVTVGLAFADTIGPYERRISSDGGATWSAWEAYGAVATATLPGADGTKTVVAEVRDLAGNVGTAADEIILDRTGPSIALEVPLEGATLDVSELVDFLYAASDVSDVAASSATLDGRTLANAGSIDAGLLLTGDHRIVVDATDSLENSSRKTFVFSVHPTVAGIAHEIDDGVANGEIDPNMRTPFLAKLHAGQFRAFSNQVRAQSGKKVDAGLAKRLVDWAEDLGAGR
jgi:hypothetical protein